MFIILFIMFLLAFLPVAYTATVESGLTRWPRMYVCVFITAVSACIVAYLLAQLIK